MSALAVAAGATVLVERGLGDLAHFPDAAYADAGAQLVADAAAATSLRQVSGVSATRRSPGAVSRATPIVTAMRRSAGSFPAS